MLGHFPLLCVHASCAWYTLNRPCLRTRSVRIAYQVLSNIDPNVNLLDFLKYLPIPQNSIHWWNRICSKYIRFIWPRGRRQRLGVLFWSSGIHVPSPCCHVRVHRQCCSAFWLLCACASASGIAMAGHDHGKATICVVFPCNYKKIPARRHGHSRHQGQGKDGAFVEKEIEG
jgi:hypothetical protein